MKAKITGLLILLLSSQWIVAQNSAAEQEIAQLSKDKWKWMAEKNVEVLNDLFHEKSMFVHMGGSWGKTRELKIIKGGSIWYKMQISMMCQ